MVNPSEIPEMKETADVRAQRVARVYAEALFRAASKRGETDLALEEIESLVNDAFRSDPRLEVFFSSAAIGRYARQDAIAKVFRGKASESFHSFLQILNNHERLELIRPIARALRELSDQRANRVQVHVTTAVPMPADQLKTLADDLRVRLKMEPVMTNAVDPTILGGMKLRLGDTQYDASVRSRIENIRTQILARSSHEIQSRRDRFCSAE